MDAKTSPKIRTIRVSSTTVVPSLAGSLVTLVEEKPHDEILEVRVIGASSLSQAYKGIACACGILEMRGITVLVKPMFGSIEENGLTKTTLIARLVVMPREEA